MPLANAISRETIYIEGVLPDGTPYTDSYILKGALGFYDVSNLLLAGMTVDDLKYFRKRKEDGKAETETKEPMVGPMFAERDLLILKTWLIGWSHDAPLTDENIREIPPAHSKAIIEKIKSIGEGARLSPFPGDTRGEGVSGADNPGEGDQQLDDLHPEGAGIEGAQLDADLSGPGSIDLIPAS